MNVEQLKRDINKIDEDLKSNELNVLTDLMSYLVGTYLFLVRKSRDGFKTYSNESIESYNKKAYDKPKKKLLTEKEIISNLKFNINIIRTNMLLEIPNPVELTSETNYHISANSNAENHNQISIEINVTFDAVREQIKSMQNTLDEQAVNEILEKIDELEKIIQSKDKKYEKWSKARDIGKWILDKSVDVGISLLPLLLKIGA